MDNAKFLENEKKVLTAAYTYAGINPEEHIHAEAHLGKRTPKDEPFRIPLNVQLLKSYAAKDVVGPSKKKEFSFIPVNDSTTAHIPPPKDGNCLVRTRPVEYKS